MSEHPQPPIDLQHTCAPGEGPPAAVEDPDGRGPHPLVFRSNDLRYSRNATVGYAQQLLNRFLAETPEGFPGCVDRSAPRVASMQQLRDQLRRNGQDPLTVDCRFGPGTELATKFFQTCHGLVADGKIGPVTWSLLDRAARPSPPPLPAPQPPPPQPRYWQGVLRRGLSGNTVEPLVDGPAAFRAIRRAIDATGGDKDFIYLLGWWCDPWVNLDGLGTCLLDLFARAGDSGVQIRVLVWGPPNIPSYGNHVRLHSAAVAALNRLPNCHAQIDSLGLSELTKSHHQKLLVVHSADGLVALAGGVDINADRIHPLPPPPGTVRVDRPNLGWASGSGGSGPVGAGTPLHDVHTRVTGPSALILLRVFLRRWWARSGGRTIDTHYPLRAKAAGPPPPATGRQFARVGETFKANVQELGRPPVFYRERTVQDIWLRCLLAARRFVYMEEQYLISLCAAEAIRRVIGRLDHVTFLIPPSEITDLPGVWRRRKAFIDHITGGRDMPKLRVYTPVSGPPTACVRTVGRHLYVHSKLAVIDDELLLIGSANCNNRGWESDSELVVASFEDPLPSGVQTAAQLRRTLWSHHLDQPVAFVADPIAAKGLWDTAPSRRVCRYNPTAATDPFNPGDIDRIADPADRQRRDPCCTLLGMC